MTALSPVTVLGAGAFGTALSVQLASRQPVRLWGRNAKQMHSLQINRYNQHYLPEIFLSGNIDCTADLRDAVAGVQDILIALPSHVLPTFLGQTSPFFAKNARLLLATKGLNPNFLDSLSKSLRGFGISWALLSGPSFAKEVARNLATALVVASHNSDCAKVWQQRLRHSNFHVSYTNDVMGVALGGAMKNVIAIAVGIADGLELGANTRALLITQGISELEKLGNKLRAQMVTFMGPAGIGDLYLTCTSDESRNRRLGIAIGRGLSTLQAKKSSGLLTEGIKNTVMICKLAKPLLVTLPLCQMVYTILFEKLAPKAAIFNLIHHVGTYASEL